MYPPFLQQVNNNFFDSQLVLVGLWLLGFISSLGHAGKEKLSSGEDVIIVEGSSLRNHAKGT